MIISEDVAAGNVHLSTQIWFFLHVGFKWIDIPAVSVCLRPLSKTVRFNVLKVIPKGASDGGTKKVFAAVWNWMSVFVWQLWIFYSFSMFEVSRSAGLVVVCITNWGIPTWIILISLWHKIMELKCNSWACGIQGHFSEQHIQLYGAMRKVNQCNVDNEVFLLFRF
jgi:hypothetical protein